MTICSLKESALPPSKSDSNGNDDKKLEIHKPSDVLSGINVCRRYISAISCKEKSLNSIISFQKIGRAHV